MLFIGAIMQDIKQRKVKYDSEYPNQSIIEERSHGGDLCADTGMR